MAKGRNALPIITIALSLALSGEAWGQRSDRGFPLSAPLTEADIAGVVDHLTGSMSTAEQARGNPDKVSVRMTTCPITVADSAPGTFLYQEQALSDSLDEPYRQRFIQVALGESGQRVESRSFRPVNSEEWTGLCEQPEPSRTVTIADLGEAVCTVELRPSALGYVGSTPTAGCATTVRGAVRVQNVIVLHDRGMDTWDRGFAADGTQIWGAEDEPYRYRWLEQL
ncbi:chromophore lyase CpcT/CpeT [Romeria aff. gracilis LEGE 07310]|uniref:Chromophore lyase CpcT/CpeT n=1 Tax=Vasconcelosia minhoensis LEGE 07310 TaxID=915328 RepID=A0A8J7APK5_9CYAN|nr:chromophore lyase CpcT/CpeT [Romeria gracilis]MBE9078219.1 chromophore lyase CpcT/CpeT [Romeria aff. gracilis LEGE 07310]